MRLPRRAALAGLAWLACAGAGLAPAAPAGQAAGPAYLWVGNSYFRYHGGIERHVAGLARGLEPPQEVVGLSVTISGAGLARHDVESYLRRDRMGRYVAGDGEPPRFHAKGRKFDGVVMMDCSRCPLERPGAFDRYARLHAAAVARYGARPVLFLSWAYADRPEMTARLEAAYSAAARASGARVIPAGLAFARVREARPDIRLHAPDGRHPSLAGTYLAASTALAALTGRSPVPSTYAAGLDEELARYLRQAAWDTVRDYDRG